VSVSDMCLTVQMFGQKGKHLFVEHLFKKILDTEHLFG
jgi:hypothetical protein